MEVSMQVSHKNWRLVGRDEKLDDAASRARYCGRVGGGRFMRVDDELDGDSCAENGIGMILLLEPCEGCSASETTLAIAKNVQYRASFADFAIAMLE